MIGYFGLSADHVSKPLDQLREACQGEGGDLRGGGGDSFDW